MLEGISIEKIANPGYRVGLGYVVIPSDVDRDLFIGTCCRKERLDILLDGGGSVLNNCLIDNDVIQRVIFPNTYKELGSCVVFVTNEISRQPIVIGIINRKSDSLTLEENNFKKVVRDKSGVVSIEGRAKEGGLFINVESDFDKNGNIFITLKNKNKTSKFNLKCFGDINIYSEGETTVESIKTTSITSSYIDGNYKKLASKISVSNDGFKYEDKNGNTIEITEGDVIIKPNTKLQVFEGNSPMVLGDTLKKELDKSKKRIDDLINYLQIATKLLTVETAFQTSLTSSLASIIDKEDYDHINSEKSFLD